MAIGMRVFVIASLAGAALLAVSLFAAAPQSPPALVLDELEEVTVKARTPLPLEAFLDFPEFDSVAISPSGTRLAMGWTGGNYVRLLTISEFPSMKRLESQALQQHAGASDLHWSSDRWLLVQPDYPRRGYLRVRDPLGSLFVIDPDRHTLRTINEEPLAQAAAFEQTLMSNPLNEQREDDAARQRSPERTTSAQAGRKPERTALGPVRLLAARTADPDQSLFQTTRADNKTGSNNDGYGAFVLNMPEFKQSRIATLPLPNGQFVTGPDGRIALVTGINQKNEQVIYYLPPEARASGRGWQLRVSDRSGERGLRPIAWTGNGEEYYALDGSGPTRAVVVWNAASNTQRLLYRNADVDMDHFALDPAGRPWMFSGAGLFPVYWYPDVTHPLVKLHQYLAKKLPGEQIDVMNANDEMSIAVVRVSSGRRTPVYLVMDVNTGTSLTGMQTYPKLRITRLAQVDPVEFLARDGLLIRGYLTTPTDADNKPLRGVPLVVIAHDGLQAEPASARYEFERQLFASRGYAVLQVNRRGSGGRGTAFEHAGDGNWGREVQQDYVDGARWAIRSGVAASGRVCFYGQHYGAYSALTAAALEPDVFKCVIGIAGFYDLPAMVDKGKAIPAALQQMFGNSMQELRERSPTSHAAAIKAKVLLIQQDNDEQVPRDQFLRMLNALRIAGITPQTGYIGSTLGGYYAVADRVAVYDRMLGFLEKNIGKGPGPTSAGSGEDIITTIEPPPQPQEQQSIPATVESAEEPEEPQAEEQPGMVEAASSQPEQPAKTARVTPAIDTLEDTVVSNDRERQRQNRPAATVRDPDTIAVTRNKTVSVRLQPYDGQPTIRFRRESAARTAPDNMRPPMTLQRDLLTSGDGSRIRNITLGLAANIDEPDGLPALIPFGPRTSLVNLDHVRLRDTSRPSITTVSNLIHPQTRKCAAMLGFADDGENYGNRFVLLADRLKDCEQALKNREGDLFFADGVPERLRKDLREVYDPIYSRFALMLGSEPALLFVAWRPDSPRSDFIFRRNWDRSVVLLFNGADWQQGLSPKQRDALWEEFASEQIVRRLGWQAGSSTFVESAVNYLLMLARYERRNETVQRLTSALPLWIESCAQDLNFRPRTGTSSTTVRSYDCGLVLQFVYDAAARAKSRGRDTVFGTWRGLLDDSFRHGRSGAEPAAFVAASGDAQRIMEGLLDRSMDWRRFAEELGKLGVQLKVLQGPLAPQVEVLSLDHFRD